MAASHATASLDQLDVAFATGPFQGILGGDCIHDVDVLGCGSTGSGVWLFCRDSQQLPAIGLQVALELVVGPAASLGACKGVGSV